MCALCRNRRVWQATNPKLAQLAPQRRTLSDFDQMVTSRRWFAFSARRRGLCARELNSRPEVQSLSPRHALDSSKATSSHVRSPEPTRGRSVSRLPMFISGDRSRIGRGAGDELAGPRCFHKSSGTRIKVAKVETLRDERDSPALLSTSRARAAARPALISSHNRSRAKLVPASCGRVS